MPPYVYSIVWDKIEPIEPVVRDSNAIFKNITPIRLLVQISINDLLSDLYCHALASALSYFLTTRLKVLKTYYSINIMHTLIILFILHSKNIDYGGGYLIHYSKTD